MTDPFPPNHPTPQRACDPANHVGDCQSSPGWPPTGLVLLPSGFHLFIFFSFTTPVTSLCVYRASSYSFVYIKNLSHPVTAFVSVSIFSSRALLGCEASVPPIPSSTVAGLFALRVSVDECLALNFHARPFIKLLPRASCPLVSRLRNLI